MVKVVLVVSLPTCLKRPPLNTLLSGRAKLSSRRCKSRPPCWLQPKLPALQNLLQRFNQLKEVNLDLISPLSSLEQSSEVPLPVTRAGVLASLTKRMSIKDSLTMNSSNDH